MATTDLTTETFEQTLKDNDIVLVDWWASWCGPCRMFAPIFEQVSESNEDIVFGKVDTEAEVQLASAAQITSIPTLMAFREGIMVFRESGALPAQALEQLIEQIRGLDMDDVRRQVEEAQAESEAGAAAADSGAGGSSQAG
ncbi:thioredoxin [Marihabitans asiaticum]|uniref:Thioredoxin n=1 Tax=Marihabitans asiaticum TaxID=415218 RepID=A0A560WG38_9MICO|nr:thioredoxin [Marihabitans asiaticum]TWD16649.1 thioredoxin [Marihabitans asiaticum]